MLSKKEKAIKIIELLEREGIKLKRQNFSPFQSLVATLLSARTRDERTLHAAKELFKKFPNAKSLANAKLKEVEETIREVGFYRQKAKHIVKLAKIILERYNGKTPNSFDELIKLPGVGTKTASCVLCNAFNKAAICVDTHVHRLSNFFGIVNTNNPEETRKELEKILPREYWCKINSCFVALGQRICKANSKNCEQCPLKRAKLCKGEANKFN